MRLFFVLLLTFLIFNPSYAQFGKLKEKAKKAIKVIDDPVSAIKEEGYKKLNEARTAYDSSNFHYAIDLIDNAALFRNKELGAKFRDGLLDIGRESRDKTSLERAQGMINAGEFFYASNSYKLANFYFNAAKLLLETEGLTNTLEYPKVIADLGLLYHTMGRYTRSQSYTYEALEMRKDMLGEESHAYAASLNNMAVLKKDLGEYNEAEKMIYRANEISGEYDGDESLPYAFTTNNKAMLSFTVGRLEQAEKFMQKALEVADKSMREKAGNYQRLMTNLAMVYSEMADYEKAEEIYLNALDIHNKKLAFGKKNDPDYAHMLSNLASLYITMGKLEEVEDLLNEAIAIYEKKFGKEHPAYASAISDLGKFYMYQGKYREASYLFEESLGIRETTLGKDHPDYVNSREDLAIINWKTENYKRALDQYAGVMEKTVSFIEEYFDPMSEAEKAKYWAKLYPRFQRFYSFAADIHDQYPEILIDVYNYHLITKAILLNSTTRIKNQILSGDDQSLIEDYLTWLDQKESLAGYYSYTKEELQEENVNLDSLETAANSLEKSLSERSSIFYDGYEKKNPRIKDLRDVLQGQEVAVEIIRVDYFENQFTGKIYYLALILKPGSSNPEVVVIDNGSELENKYFKYYRNVIQQQFEDEFTYDQFWKPVEDKLGGVSDIYLSVDGIYNQLNINSILRNDGSYVIDDKKITLLSSTRELLEESNEVTITEKQAFLIGNPDFGLTTVVKPLPGTKEEIRNIRGILQNAGIETKVVTDKEASEHNIKDVKDPRLVHIATHGYFLEDVNTLKETKVFGIEPGQARNNPLLRSGIMLANAGFTVDNMPIPSLEVNENGMLTAYEAMNLPLNGTELVVLSACETGLGDVKAGEGVYGLQRAFQVAGTDALIMSLWKVNDQATQELMTNFYNLWAGGMEKRQALRQAQLKLKDKYGAPYYWGAFVMVGM